MSQKLTRADVRQQLEDLSKSSKGFPNLDRLTSFVCDRILCLDVESKNKQYFGDFHKVDYHFLMKSGTPYKPFGLRENEFIYVSSRFNFVEYFGAAEVQKNARLVVAAAVLSNDKLIPYYVETEYSPTGSQDVV